MLQRLFPRNPFDQRIHERGRIVVDAVEIHGSGLQIAVDAAHEKAAVYALESSLVIDIQGIVFPVLYMLRRDQHPDRGMGWPVAELHFKKSRAAVGPSFLLGLKRMEKHRITRTPFRPVALIVA